MLIRMKNIINAGWKKLKRKDGSFLLEAMMGTAILSIVLVFFASVSVSAFLLMQMAYYETEISEEVFVKVERHEYSSVASGKKNLSTADHNLYIEAENAVSGNFVEYVVVDGTKGALNSADIRSNSVKLLPDDLYTFQYHGSKGNYSATFYILKGEK